MSFNNIGFPAKMSKLKQVLRLSLITLNSIILAGAIFVFFGHQHLIYQSFSAPYKQQKAIEFLHLILRLQQAYVLGEQEFADSFEDLSIELYPDVKSYTYHIYTGIQTTFNDYLFLNLDKTQIEQLLKIPTWARFTSPKQLPRVSSDILMITAQPKQFGLKTYIGFIFSCDDPSTGGSDCGHESLTFAMAYQSEQSLTPPPTRLNVSLPLTYCAKGGCLRQQVPTPEGFRLIEDNN